MLAQHRKELKSFDGEKRAAIKKAKALKGKKGKEALASLEKEFDEKLKLLKDKHGKEIKAGNQGDAIDEENKILTSKTEDDNDDEEKDRLRKLEKARRKREAKKDKERERQEKIEQEAAEAGPSSLRQNELEMFDTQLKPLSLKIVEIPSDGNCLYRAIAAQCDTDYTKIRKFFRKIFVLSLFTLLQLTFPQVAYVQRF